MIQMAEASPTGPNNIDRSPMPLDNRALSPWDSVPERIGRLRIGFVGAAQRIERLHARTRDLERLCQGVDASEAGRPAVLALGTDLAVRRRAWRSILGLDPTPPPLAPLAAIARKTHAEEESPVLASLRSAPETFAAEFVFAGSIGVVLLLIVAGAVWLALVVAVIGGAVFAHRPLLRRRLARALDSHACPKCYYDLRGIAPRQGLDEMLALHVGPSRCPECGCAWPLVPATVAWTPRPEK